ncbi:MAG: 3-isopropylmalate dehydratase large subunit, partial [Peptococcaceae bacterium]|nr:3-isopropylmalate dehydratase large subunit [Peptococcaceae bacterium]
MGMTMTQKIIAAHAGLPEVHAGQLVTAKVDMVLSNDITGPVAIREMNKVGLDCVFDKNKIAMIPDHFSPAKDIKSAEQCKAIRDFAKAHEIKHYYEVGKMGVEHCLLPEQGIVGAGQLIIGADSHTCTYGAVGAFSTGMGSTDIAAAMISGETWLKVPEAIKVVVTGEPTNSFVSGKDVILYLIGMIGVDGALYQSLEFVGDGLKHISMEGRLTIANMAIECGAKNGVFPVDEICKEYLADRFDDDYNIYEADDDAEYTREIIIDLSKLVPQVAFPHLPSNTHPINEIEKIAIDQVVIGSCTNGRLEDMRIAGEILKGKKVAPYLRLIVIPGTQAVYEACMKEGIIQTILDAGGVVSTPTCGPCLGGYM